MIVEMRADHGRDSAGWTEEIVEAPSAELQDVFDFGTADAGRGRGWGRALLAVALVASAAWIAGALWLARDALPTLEPVALVELIAAIASIPALIGIAWLLAMRTSYAEARRFADTAASLRTEAASLERTAATIGEALEANRAVLSTQLAQLGTLGDAASERLGAISRGMASDIADADSHVHHLSEAAAAAQANVGILLASLPRARSETEDMARLLDETGLSAGEHAAALDAQLIALGERGREADAIAGGAANRLAAHITRMEVTSETAGARLEAVTGDMSGAVDALLGRTAQAVDEARKGIAAQGDAMLAMIGANQAALDSAVRDNAEALASRIATVEAAIDRMAARLEAQRHVGDDFVATVEGSISRVDTQMHALHAQGIERSQLLAASIGALGSSAEAMTEALRTGDALATRTIGTTESLLIALDAATREIDETLPEALGRLDARIAQSKSVVVQAKPELLALVTAAESTHDAIEAIAGVVGEQRRTLENLSTTLHETLTTGRTKADALGQMVDETIGRSNAFADESAPRLMEALLRVRETAAIAADQARETLLNVIPQAAEQLHDASAEAMRRATTDTVKRQIDFINDATDQAVTAATRATETLAAQVQTLLDQADAVKGKIEQERAERESLERDTLSRRVAPLIDALNSASIDITKAFAPEVSDTAWQAYLKGDRGVFTRRAVRIIDGATARDVARLYDEHDDFREMVNRYIHDFESMLRAILTERDGSPLGVTLLSSDMGKLYVALAQAIERLR
jgi:hypothetical protein